MQTSLSETEIIERYFNRKTTHQKNTVLGIGDDCALLDIPSDKTLVLTTDTLIAGVHFPVNTKPCDIGYKTLAVNLSDLASMGAHPKWIMVALTLTNIDEPWLKEFTKDFLQLANQHALEIIGGDITHGPTLSITISAYGLIDKSHVLKRSGANIGDQIYVTGTLGDPGLALHAMKNKLNLPDDIRHGLMLKLNRPTPLIEVGIALSTIASSAIDISDGIAQDLNHILRASQVGATIHFDRLPLSHDFKQYAPDDLQPNLSLAAGDDYQLCFTASKSNEKQLLKTLSSLNCPITCIGQIETAPGLRIKGKNGHPIKLSPQGYDHFSEDN